MKALHVAEQPVFWLGGSPSKKTTERPVPEAERYEPALRDACVSCGYEVDEFVAALGGFGGWLTHLERSGNQYRVFWSGKSKQLVFEIARPHGWDELATIEKDDEVLPGFVEAVKSLLNEHTESS